MKRIITASSLLVSSLLSLMTPAQVQSAEVDLSDFDAYIMDEMVEVDEEVRKGLQVDVTDLQLVTDYNVRFIAADEGAGYQNRVELNIRDESGAVTDNSVLFYNFSCMSTDCVMPNLDITGGFMPGDSVSVQAYAGDILDPTLIINGGINPSATDFWSTQTQLNADRQQHVLAWVHDDCSSVNIIGKCLVLGFEDLPSWAPNSDNDFNDNVIIADVGQENIQSFIPVIYAD